MLNVKINVKKNCHHNFPEPKPDLSIVSLDHSTI